MVWEKGRFKFKKEGNKLFGFGILDMKGGIIQFLWVIKVIQELEFFFNKKIVFFCNLDEEIGLIVFKEYIEEEVKKSEVVFVVEFVVVGLGVLKIFCKGVGIFKLKIWGCVVYVGNYYEDGVNVIEELVK